MDYAGTKGNINPHLTLSSAWRVPEWNVMKDAVTQVRLLLPNNFKIMFMRFSLIWPSIYLQFYFLLDLAVSSTVESFIIMIVFLTIDIYNCYQTFE